MVTLKVIETDGSVMASDRDEPADKQFNQFQGEIPSEGNTLRLTSQENLERSVPRLLVTDVQHEFRERPSNGDVKQFVYVTVREYDIT